MSTTGTVTPLNPAAAPAKWLSCSAATLCLALATTLLPGSASAQIDPAGNFAYLGLFHTSENSNVCINDPGQSTTNGTQIRVSQNCNTNDPASLWVLMQITLNAGVYVMWNPHANALSANLLHGFGRFMLSNERPAPVRCCNAS